MADDTLQDTLPSDALLVASHLEARALSAMTWTTRAQRAVQFGAFPMIPLALGAAWCSLRRLASTADEQDVKDLRLRTVEYLGHSLEHLQELNGKVRTLLDLADKTGISHSAINGCFIVSWIKEDAERVGDLAAAIRSWAEIATRQDIVMFGARENPDPRWDEVRRQIHALRMLQTGWDSHGSAAVAPGAIEQALAFVDELSVLPWQVPIPVVGPSPEGGVALQWRTVPREIEVIFLPKGAEYSVFDRESEKFVEDRNELLPDRAWLAREVVAKYTLQPVA